MSQSVQRGEIYLMPWGEGKLRPVVVVSRDDHNHGECVVVVPFTSQKLEERSKYKSCVFFRGDDSAGLTCDCIAKTDEISRVSIKEFHWKAGRQGRIDAEGMQRIVRAIRYLVRDDELSSSPGKTPPAPTQGP